MSDAVKVALLSGGLTLVGTILTILFTNRHTLSAIEKNSELSDAKLDAKLEKHQAVTDTKIDELTREVREHNNFARRMPVIEEKVASLERRMENVQQ